MSSHPRDNRQLRVGIVKDGRAGKDSRLLNVTCDRVSRLLNVTSDGSIWQTGGKHGQTDVNNHVVVEVHRRSDSNPKVVLAEMTN